MADQITGRQWLEAKIHLDNMLKYAYDLANDPNLYMGFYIQGCLELARRYNHGERTQGLYDEIMELH